MLLQMILDSRALLKPGQASELDDITRGMNRLGGDGSSSGNSEHPEKMAARMLQSSATAGAEASGAAFAQRIGVIFSAMYNMFVDADVLSTVRDVAGRLAASAASLDLWSSSELGRLVHFTDDRSQDRVHQKEGILDPFPLLLEEQASPTRRGRATLVNPLLLVTERKGTAYSLHYGAFPLDAFNTDVSLWNVRPEALQDEYGKLAPRVTKCQQWKSGIEKGSPTNIQVPPRVLQDACLGTALEELAQMCGAFLGATVTPTSSTVPAVENLNIKIHVGDALNFCDAILAANDAARRGFGTTLTPPVAFQQGTLQPLQFRAGIFGGAALTFDVIKSSNLADHLGILNLVVASAPLLNTQPHAVLLTSFLATAQATHLFEGTSGFHEKLLCMNANAAAVLL
ncbi:unnamed protein product, partial [Pylaiella littoralis]